MTHPHIALVVARGTIRGSADSANTRVTDIVFRTSVGIGVARQPLKRTGVRKAHVVGFVADALGALRIFGRTIASRAGMASAAAAGIAHGAVQTIFARQGIVHVNATGLHIAVISSARIVVVARNSHTTTDTGMTSVTRRTGIAIFTGYAVRFRRVRASTRKGIADTGRMALIQRFARHDVVRRADAGLAGFTVRT